ncbi:ABC transporter permease [Larkinella soli]|uniref:ABC transporter permease n=1 Tax=Larkinella soli TaxID=1770527 RepID=UPI000FFBD251|nr:ABC transporter permease [Larkinella soli]
MKEPFPPALAQRLLRWFCAPHLLDEMESDLDELFHQRVGLMGLRRARWRYWRDVLSLMRPFVMKRQPTPFSNPTTTDMIRNHFLLAWRGLKRHRSFTALNVLGLSVGVAAALLLFMTVRYELSFDRFHTDPDRIYRIVREQVLATGDKEFTPGNPLPVAAALKTDLPQLEIIAPVFGTLDPQVTVLGSDPNAAHATAKFLEDDEGLMVGPEFFRLFNFRWLIGQPGTLARPNVVALSRKFAEKYFGDAQQAVGKFVRINNHTTMQVVGVLADAPSNTSFPMNLVISYATKQADRAERFGFGSFADWGSTSSNDQIFVRLPPNFPVATANALLVKFSRKHYEGQKDRDKKTHFLSPLAEMHHDQRYDTFSNQVAVVPRSRIWNLAIVGGLLLLMACVNFVNIASALASRRAKEVSVRKVLGSQKGQLVAQFLTETLFMVLVSLLLGVGLAYAALPYVSTLFNIPADASLYFRPDVSFALLGLLVLLTLLAGLYPAWILSSFSPLDVFRKQPSRGWLQGLSLRQSLIVFQFTAALVLIISTVINLRQMDYLSRLDLGFDQQGVYNFGMDTEYGPRNATLRNELLRIPGVSSVTFSSDVPSSNSKWQSTFAYSNLSKDEDFTVSLKMADGNYFQTHGITFLAGTPYAVNDTLPKFVVNETLLKKLGVENAASALGRNLRLGGFTSPIKGPIVGVVKDFHTNSARDGGVQPLLMTPSSKFYYAGSVKIRSKNLLQTVDRIKATYARVFPEVAFVGRFYEESLNAYYKAEQQMGGLYRTFAGLTIFIACLGLFGLAAFTAEQRTKEIGVRKVLGASVAGIVALLSKEFVKLVVIAILIASPVAWYLMNQWLQDFTYRIDIEWWVFAGAGVLAVGIAVLTVSFQSIKAALMNPVKSLRSE